MFNFYGVTITKDELREAFDNPDSFAGFVEYLTDVYKERMRREVLLQALKDGRLSIKDEEVDHDRLNHK